MWDSSRTPTHVRQPNDYTCAAAIAAMILGCTVEAAAQAMGSSPRIGTRHDRLILLLKGRGVPCGDRFVRCSLAKVPPRAIVRLLEPADPYGRAMREDRALTMRDLREEKYRRLGHVALKWNERVFDPSWPEGELTAWPITAALWIGSPT